MTYAEAVRYLLALGRELAAPRQPALSGAEGARVQKFDLANIRTLAEHLGHPERRYPSAHIAGTNGKGSTAAMLDSILRAAGLRAGLYTSPHLDHINERIRLDGDEISDDAFAASFSRIHALIETLLASGALAAHPTYFECLTATAFEFYAHEAADFAVFEVGMGGRLDATNLLLPEVAILTQIDFDHENYLGHSIAQIAGEKAGIVKPEGWVVSAAERPEARAVVRRRAEELGARLIDVDEAYRLESVEPGALAGCWRAVALEVESGARIELAPPLAGRYQLRNALAAAAAARLLARRGFALNDAAIARGIAQVAWPGRLERVADRPIVYLDGTHNPAGARELVAFWEEQFRGRRILLVYGAMRDKAVDEIAGLLFPRAGAVILTQPRQPRALSVGVLAGVTSHLAARLEFRPDPEQAFERALELAAPEDVVFITGSLYLVGDLRRAALQLGRKAAPIPARAAF
jgi:dihydrofolate synthase/folylpolyglutamate synthase